uniref:N-acetylgalactosaminide beta-1,3-galactosyltransferase n=1 Tax=Acrobeloides nanus TaxID=290746 RepID=A0A914CPS9_9BILA
MVSVDALEQPKSGSLFCYVSTSVKFHQDRIPALAQTWLPNCDSWHIYSNSNKYLNFLPYHVIFHRIPDDYKLLFWKSRLALYYSYEQVSSKFDWYLKADDDSYFIVDRLRSYLSQFDPKKPYFIGFRLKRRFVSFSGII